MTDQSEIVTGNQPDGCVIVMCKAPILGLAKTRLAQSVGDSHALRIYQNLLAHQFQHLSGMANIRIHVTPWENRELLRPWMESPWRMQSQEPGDLGERIVHAVQSAMKDQFSRILVIGVDTPGISREIIQGAWDCLSHQRAVIGPTHDGGYWCIGLQSISHWEQLFHNIDWGSERVWSQTVSKCEQLFENQWATLDEKCDLDTLEDWIKLKEVYPELGAGIPNQFT